jgi:hypothetical protein
MHILLETLELFRFHSCFILLAACLNPHVLCFRGIRSRSRLYDFRFVFRIYAMDLDDKCRGWGVHVDCILCGLCKQR